MPEIELCTRADFDQIITEHAQFWDNDLTYPLHHPIFLYEFGNSAFVIREGEKVIAYLFGFLAQTEPTGYAHLIAVRVGYRHHGLGNRLYAHFIDFCRRHGCKSIKATAAPTNHGSIAFHTKLGMRMLGEDVGHGVPVVRDYRQPGVDRVVFRMDIDT